LLRHQLDDEAEADEAASEEMSVRAIKTTHQIIMMDYVECQEQVQEQIQGQK
jgi:hypothetical protein